MKKAADCFVVVSGFILSAALAHAEVELFHEPMHGPSHGEKGDMMFKNMDANKDGKVTRQEYLDAMPILHRGNKMDSSGNSQTM